MSLNNPDSIQHIKPDMQDEFPFMVTVVLHHPCSHHRDEEFLTEILVPATLCWARSKKEVIQIARDTLVPPQYDPASLGLIVINVDPLNDYDSKAEA
jgi:hypothetical protein